MGQSTSSGAGGDPPQEKVVCICFPANDEGEKPKSSYPPKTCQKGSQPKTDGPWSENSPSNGKSTTSTLKK